MSNKKIVDPVDKDQFKEVIKEPAPENPNEFKEVFEEKVKAATSAKEITNRIDEIIVDYLDHMYDNIERDCVYSVYKAVLKHVAGKMGSDVPYKVAARIASTFASDMLAELELKDNIEEDCNEDFGINDDDEE